MARDSYAVWQVGRYTLRHVGDEEKKNYAANYPTADPRTDYDLGDDEYLQDLTRADLVSLRQALDMELGGPHE